jgi:hypothetical protein
MIAIHICFDYKFLGIAEGFLTSLQPMSDGAHDTLVTQPRGDAREHLLRLAIFFIGSVCTGSDVHLLRAQ